MFVPVSSSYGRITFCSGILCPGFNREMKSNGYHG